MQEKNGGNPDFIDPLSTQILLPIGFPGDSRKGSNWFGKEPIWPNRILRRKSCKFRILRLVTSPYRGRFGQIGLPESRFGQILS